MEEIEQALVLRYDDTVAVGVARRLDETHARDYFLRLEKIVIGSVRIVGTDDVVALELHGFGVSTAYINLGIGKIAQRGRMVGVLMGQENAGNLLRSEERRVGKECRSRWSPYH